jgi:hypothetical protein
MEMRKLQARFLKKPVVAMRTAAVAKSYADFRRLAEVILASQRLSGGAKA